MVRKLRHFKQVARDMAHQRAGAVLVIEAARKILHMGENILAHVRFDKHAHPVPDDRYHIVQHTLEHISQRHYEHDDKEGPVQILRQQRFHRLP